VIWEPFVLALFLGLIVSAGLYFAYLWPSVEPEDNSLAEPLTVAADSRTGRAMATGDVTDPGAAATEADAS
jgi:hypothetical protein